MDDLQASKGPEIANTSFKPSFAAANRPAYFFTNDIANPELASILQSSARPNVRPAKVLGFKVWCIEEHYVIMHGTPYDHIFGQAHHLCDKDNISDLRTFALAKSRNLVVTTVNIQCMDDLTHVLALMSFWIPDTIQKPQDDRSLAEEVNILQFPGDTVGRSSRLANIRFGQFEPPALPLTAPNIIMHSPPAYPPAPTVLPPPASRLLPPPASRLLPPPVARLLPPPAPTLVFQPLITGHEPPQTLFPRPFLLYGSQEDPYEIARLLGLQLLPSIHKGCVKGYKKMLVYGKQTVVFGSKDDIVRGVVYVVQTKEDAQKLRPGIFYRAFHCGLRPDEAPADGQPHKIADCSRDGAIYKWVGDQSELRVMEQLDGDMDMGDEDLTFSNPWS